MMSIKNNTRKYENVHSKKLIVYGCSGFGKSYVIISNILRECEKVVLISANGDATWEFKCMNLEGVEINVAEPEELTLYDKVAIPKTGIPSAKMYEFFNQMLDKIESSGFSNDETRTIIFSGFGGGHFQKNIVERINTWICKVVIDYTGSANMVEEQEIPDIMNSNEWEKYPLYNSLRPGSKKIIPGLHFISGEGAKNFCDELNIVGKGSVSVEPRRLFGKDGFLIKDCNYAAMTAEEQEDFFKHLLNIGGSLEIKDL